VIFPRRTRPSASSPQDQAELRRQADEARERLLAAIVVRVPPPPDPTRTDPRTVVATGCLLCGLGAVEVPGGQRLDGVVEVPALAPDPDGSGGRAIAGHATFATARGALRVADVDRDRLAATLWQHIVCQPRSIGAPPSGSYVSGYLCPGCDDAVVEHDGPGLPAVTASLGLDAANVEVTRLSGVTFGARVLDARKRGAPEPEPGRTRWEHVRIDTAEPEPPASVPIPADAMLWLPASEASATPAGPPRREVAS